MGERHGGCRRFGGWICWPASPSYDAPCFCVWTCARAPHCLSPSVLLPGRLVSLITSAHGSRYSYHLFENFFDSASPSLVNPAPLLNPPSFSEQSPDSQQEMPQNLPHVVGSARNATLVASLSSCGAPNPWPARYAVQPSSRHGPFVQPPCSPTAHFDCTWNGASYLLTLVCTRPPVPLSRYSTIQLCITWPILESPLSPFLQLAQSPAMSIATAFHQLVAQLCHATVDVSALASVNPS